MKKLARRGEQAAPLPRIPLREPGVADRRHLSPAQAGLSAQRPLAPDDGVVAEGRERKALRPLPTGARARYRSEYAHCPQRVGAEVACPLSHPARMAAACTEADSVRV